MKKSFSMVELIFAIIVIALAIGGLPAVLNQSKDSTEMSINQEAIWMASGFIFDIMDYKWDEQSDNSVNGSVRRVVGVSNGDSNLNRVIDYENNKSRIGHIREDGRRSFFKDNTIDATTPANLGIDADDTHIISGTSYTFEDDMDDFINGVDLNARIGQVIGVQGYKRNYTPSVEVFYISDNANHPLTGVPTDGQYKNNQNITFNLSTNPSTLPSNSTNIKFIRVRIGRCLPDGTDEHIITLNSFTCNIGEYYDLMNKKSKVF